MINVSTAALCAPAGEFAAVRPRLLAIASRILGNRAEAEDIVQETWLRWQADDRSAVVNPTAFLVTIATRLAINAAQSARSRHESYVGEWISEPVDPRGDPALGAERTEMLESGLLLLLERLSPVERAAFVLRRAFDYPYPRIAGILRLSEANTRQFVSRAGKRLAAVERRRTVSAAERQELFEAFVAAADGGEVAALEALFALDAVAPGRDRLGQAA